ncbi:MAG: hypothetical protein E7474_11640 [Ruminococcaceae bacterium]|nr:hypothetical protein [Oscillospiraceae bacterium]
MKITEKKRRSAGEKLRRGWLIILIAMIAVPLLLLLSHVTQQSGQSAEPGYTYEVDGQWERTGFRILGPTAANGGADVRASADDSAIVYDFTTGSGHAQVKLTYPDLNMSKYAVKELYNADEHIELMFEFAREADADETPGDVSAVICLAGAAELNADGTVELTNREPFRAYYSMQNEILEPVTYAAAQQRNSEPAVVGNAVLPVGQADGEPLCIVLDVTDEQSGVRTLAVWDFRWKQGPITVEVPPQYGPIEYYDSPVGMLAKLLAILSAAAVPVLLIRQAILATKTKKEKP